MNPELKYVVESKSDDGLKLTSKFMTPVAAYTWVQRLSDEGTSYVAYKNGKTVSLSELKKEAGPCLTSNKKTVKSSKKR